MDRQHNGFLSDATLELITCDCDLTRVVMAGKSEILDVGRATRTSTAQWKALVARDRHCQHPGCDRPPSRCQAHHRWHWINGGPTDLDNLRLYCLATTATNTSKTPKPAPATTRSAMPDSRDELSSRRVLSSREPQRGR